MFVFLCRIYSLGMLPSNPSMLLQMGKISFFFMAEQYFIVYIYKNFLICSSITQAASVSWLL